MADGKNPIYSENDAMDINELASLNEDISNDFIEQLQSQVSKNVQNFSTGDDTQLFEEIKTPQTPEITEENKPSVKKTVALNDDIDDNFIKKYKAKLQKQQNMANVVPEETVQETVQEAPQKTVPEEEPVQPQEVQNNVEPAPQAPQNIEEVSGGNIIEKPLSQDNLKYKESLDYVDGNTKYSKYVIYIDPENKDFIDSLTVKERKNLINRIIREQDDVAMTKKRLGKMQTIISHIIVAALTVTLFIPLIYWAVNASLEATINNYRSSQSMFQTLYKEHGKIKTK